MDPQKTPQQDEMQRRNRRFGIALAVIVAGIFVVTFAIAIFVHYEELHRHVAGGL